MIKKSVEPVCPFFDNHQISESSKKLYISKLKKLNGSVPTSLEFLKNTKEIGEKLDAMGLNTRRSAVIAIVSCLRNANQPELYKHYTELMDGLNKMERETTKDTKSEKQAQNWMSLPEIEALRKEKSVIVKKVSKRKDITDGQFRELLAFTILSLYTVLPPRRSLDYVAMELGEPTNDRDKNYYHDKYFTFNNFKTARTYKQQIVSVPKELQDIIKVYLKFRPKNTDHLLVNAEGTPLTTKSIVSILNTITGKKISTSLLRNIYSTAVAKPMIDKLENLASAMGTSVSMLSNTYSKND
jgi:hypothetical protein